MNIIITLTNKKTRQCLSFRNVNKPSTLKEIITNHVKGVTDIDYDTLYHYVDVDGFASFIAGRTTVKINAI